LNLLGAAGIYHSSKGEGGGNGRIFLAFFILEIFMGHKFFVLRIFMFFLNFLFGIRNFYRY